MTLTPPINYLFGEIRRANGKLYIPKIGTEEGKLHSYNGSLDSLAIGTPTSGYKWASSLPTQIYKIFSTTSSGTGDFVRTIGDKRYELKDHLGNVRVVINDIKQLNDVDNEHLLSAGDILLPTVLQYYDYYPFGMIMPGRSQSAGGWYRYGFNGKDKDDEVKGSGAQYDYGMRIYDSRLGRFLSVDPIASGFPELTPFQYAGNKPVWAVDLDGLEPWELSTVNDMTRSGYMNHVNNTFKSYLNGTNERKIITDCAKFQYFLMTTYFESSGQRLVFRGKNGQIYDSHATNADGSFKYNSFEEFFNSSKLGISTYYLKRELGQGLVRPKGSDEPVEPGEVLINGSIINGRWSNGHAEGIASDGKDFYLFYGSGNDYGDRCENCVDPRNMKLEEQDMKAIQLQDNRFSWVFLDNIPRAAPMEKMESLRLPVSRPESDRQPIPSN